MLISIFFLILAFNNSILPAEAKESKETKEVMQQFLNDLKKCKFAVAMKTLQEKYFYFDFNSTDENGDTALIIIAKKYTDILNNNNLIDLDIYEKAPLQIAELLIKNGIEINAQGYAKSTALIEASWRGFTSLVNLLLSNNADPNLKDNYNHTALMYSSMGNTQKHLDITKLLLASEKIDIHCTNDENQTASDLAKFYENKKAKKLINGNKSCQCVIL